MSDDKLWKVFSEWIRLRDADENGNCKCITCGRVNHWKKMDCGHGIGRQHKSTKFHEQNNHAQCKKCNGFEEGRKDEYCKQVDKMYGAGTWDKLLVMSRQTCKRGKFEIDMMTDYYKAEVKKLKEMKGL